MKRCFLLIACAIALALVVTGCDSDPDDPQRDPPAWLEGTWSNQGATFVINDDFSFACNLTSIVGPDEPGFPLPARVVGKLNYTAQGLGPNDYLMEDMATDGDAATYPGNAGITSAVAGYSGVLVGTMTPNASQTQFTFTSVDQQAAGFFGGAGPYTKLP